MGRRLLLWIMTLLMLTGCIVTDKSDLPPPRDEVVVVYDQDPIQVLRDGSADVVVVKGPVPEGLAGFLLERREQVLMQGWLDAPLSLTRAEAEALAARVGRPGEPAPGAMAAGRLSDLRPGWRPIPVDGVAPTPQTVSDGTYPLSGLVSVVYRPGADEAVLLAAQQLGAAPPAEAPWIRLSVAGDLMLARGVARAMREHGTLYPIEQVKGHLASADLTFANLESPIGVKGAPLPGKQIWFRAAPEAVDLLKAGGFDGVAIANNHILDYDTENFLETLAYLEQAGIGYVGGGRTIGEARKPLILRANGVRVAFLGYSQFADLFFDWGYPRSFAATETIPGVARIDEAWLAEDIKLARAQADVVAVTFHWGEEFQNYPTEEQRRLARLSVDLGADLVLGYHPHAIQGFELYKNGFIAYSTGNFIMDRQDTDLARESMILDFQIAPGGVQSVTVHPVWIRAEQPYIMAGAEGEQLLGKMRVLSGWK